MLIDITYISVTELHHLLSEDVAFHQLIQMHNYEEAANRII